MAEIGTKCQQCDTVIIRDPSARNPKRLCETCRHENQKARCRAYKQKNKPHVSEYNAKYKAERKEEISKYNKAYSEVYRPEIQKRVSDRLKADPVLKAMYMMRSRMAAFYTGGSTTKAVPEMLACTYTDFVLWIKFQFTDGMTMENHADVWEYDHVIPCAAFDHSKRSEQRRCFHWSNIQPLFIIDNRTKNDKLKRSDIDAQLYKINAFIEKHGEEVSTEMTIFEYDRYMYVNC